LESDDLPFEEGESDLTVWVEWAASVHGSANLTAKGSQGGDLDTLTFHTFRSVAIVVGGFNQTPADPPADGDGFFQIAIDLYRSGWDAHMYAQSHVAFPPDPNDPNAPAVGTGDAYDEVVNAVENRHVEFVGIVGFSWGGGAIYNLADGLAQSGTGVELRYTAYLDAITRGLFFAETRRPPGSVYHANHFQENGFLHGAAMQEDERDEQQNHNGTDHSDLDDTAAIRNLIRDGLTDPLKPQLG
jgi:hypothetical protein